MRVLRRACAQVACAVVILALSFPAAAEIAGKYSVEGREAESETRYTGEAVVERDGDTYHVVWTIGDQMAIGTGILTDDGFAVTYMLRGAQVPGIAFYKVAPDGKLSGQFTMLGAAVVGIEEWDPLAG